MVKRLYAIVVLCFSMFIAATCKHDLTVKTATFYVHNDSGFQVTEVTTWSSRSIDNGFREILEPDEHCTFTPEWVDSMTMGIPFNFKMNGKEYGTWKNEEDITGKTRFIPAIRTTDGDTVAIHIYDDHWEWRTVE